MYYIYNYFENLKKVLHELPQNEGNNSHFLLSKNVVSDETCVPKKLDNYNLIDKITLTLTPNMYYLCTCDCPAGRTKCPRGPHVARGP